MAYSFMNFKETFKAIGYFLEAGIAPNLTGETGIGKTELLAHYATSKGMDLIPLQVAQIEPSDLVGLYKTDDENRTVTCPPNWLPYKEQKADDGSTIVKTPEDIINKLRQQFTGEINPNGGIIFLDEVNRGHEDIRQALYQLVNERRIHTYVLPDNYYVVAASNPSSEGYEVNDFDDALTNRFAWIKFRPDTDETLGYLEGKYAGSQILKWIKTDMSLIDYGSDEWEVKGLRFSPRILEKTIRLHNALCKGNENDKFKRKIFCCIMQEEKVASMITCLNSMDYINFEEILRGSKKKDVAKIIDNKEVGLLLTIATDLSDLFTTYEFGEGKDTAYFKAKDEDVIAERVTTFLADAGEEVCAAFLDNLQQAFHNKKSIVYTQAFFNNVGKGVLADFTDSIKKGVKK